MVYYLKYKHILYLLFLLFPAMGWAQNTLSGHISDKKTGDALIGASVFIHDLKSGAVTDVNGDYIISRLPKGKFLVEIRYASYINKIIEVNIEGEKKLDIELEPSVAELHEVVVTGVSSATQAKRNPIPATIVNKEALLETSSSNIIDAITRKPGIAQIGTGPAISKPNIRGLGYNRVVTLYNGVRQEGQQWGDEHGIEIDEYSIDRVEIIKGPGSLMYGSDALGGVINMLTATPLPEGKITGSALGNYQTNNGLMGYSLMNAGNLKDINWQLRVSGKEAGNYKNKYDGTVYNSGYKEWDVNGYVGINRKWGYSQLHFTSFNQTIAMTDGTRDSSGNFTKELADGSFITVPSGELNGYAIHTPYQKIEHTRLFLTNQFILGRSRLSANVGYQLSQRKEFGDPANPDQYGLYFYLPTWNYDVKFFLPEWDGWKTSVGIGGMFQQNQNKGTEFLIPDYHLFDAGGFVFVQKQLGRLHLSGGIRNDQRIIKTESLTLDSLGQVATTGNEKFKAINMHYQNYTASAGISYAFTEDITARFNVARGYRAPNISEIASNGAHEGTYRYEYGNPSLKAETSLQFDLGMEYNSEHVTIDVSMFSNTIQNYIYASRLRGANGGDSIADPAEPIPSYMYSQGTARLYGGELSIDIHPHPLDWLHFENSFSIVRGQLLDKPDSSKYLPFMPAPRIQSELRANFKKKGNYLRNCYAKVDLDYYFRQDQFLMENQTETATPSYTLFHAGLGTDVVSTKGRKLFSLYFGVNNVFDVAYQNHLNRLKYDPINPATGRMGVYNMGRNFSIKLLIPIEFKG